VRPVGEPILEITDPFVDHGWKARFRLSPPNSWTSFTICHPPRRYKGGLIKEVSDTLFDYDTVLIGYPAQYWARTLYRVGDTTWVSDSATAIGTSVDETPPPRVVNLRGYYNPNLNVCILYWDPITPAQEPNFGGYRVCPLVSGSTEWNWNHAAPQFKEYYIEDVSNRPPGCTLIYRVKAIDRSWNYSTEWSNSCTIILQRPMCSNSPYATAFNQGRHLIRFNENKELHIVYETEGKIIYSYSTNNGEHWSKEEISYGYFPCIGIDQKGLPWVTFWREGDIVCKVKKPDNSWKEIIIYDGNNTCWAGAPAIAMGTLPKEGVIPPPQSFAYIIYPVYQGDGIPEMPAPGPYPSYYNCIMLSILDTVNIVYYLIDEGDGDNPVAHPAVAVTPADLLHLVWQKGGEIWYITNYGKISYDNWQNVSMRDKRNISESPGILSQHPFVESYGDKVIVAWREGDEKGEIYRRMRNLSSPETPDEWSEIENISESPDKESDYPVLSTSDVCVYQERIDSLNYEIFAWIKGERVNISETENSSKYPHIAVEPQSVSQDTSGEISINPEIVINTIWTEAISESLYEVRFRRYEYNPSSLIEYISVLIGESIPSPYCEQRNGTINYDEFSCDYDTSSLIYNLPYFNPNSYYLLMVVIYKERNRRNLERRSLY